MGVYSDKRTLDHSRLYQYDWNTESKHVVPKGYGVSRDWIEDLDNGFIKPRPALLNRNSTAVGEDPIVGYGAKGLYGITVEQLIHLKASEVQAIVTDSVSVLSCHWDELRSYVLPSYAEVARLAQEQVDQNKFLHDVTQVLKGSTSGIDAFRRLQGVISNEYVDMLLPVFERGEGGVPGYAFKTIRFSPLKQRVFRLSGAGFAVRTADDQFIEVEDRGFHRAGGTDPQNVLNYPVAFASLMQEMFKVQSVVMRGKNTLQEFVALLVAQLVEREYGDPTPGSAYERKEWYTYIVDLGKFGELTTYHAQPRNRGRDITVAIPDSLHTTIL